ncbi:MAG TPA: LL-diaminopimelate aminotransferase [Chloroflexota bacterium]
MEKAERLKQLPPYLFVQIRNKIREAQARGIDVISLGVGDPDHPTPSHIVEALCKAAHDPANHPYPPDEEKGMLAFREAVAGWYARRFGVQLDPQTEVLALIGSKEGNHHLALGLLNPGDLAIVPDPAYPAYLASVIFAGAEVYRVPLDPSRGFLPNLADIPTDVARRAKLLVLNYPNNPTTAVAPLEFYQEAVAFARTFDLVVCNDNPYSEIAYDGYQPVSLLRAEGALEVGVEFNSLSKPYNMTGWRIGMAVGNREVIAAMAQVKENTDSGIFAAVQHAGIAALTGPQDCVQAVVSVYQRRRDRVVGVLRELGLQVEAPRATFYVWAPTPNGMPSMDFASLLLEEAGVVVTPGIGYGSRGEGFIRLSLTVPDHRLDEALRRLVERRAAIRAAVSH